MQTHTLLSRWLSSGDVVASDILSATAWYVVHTPDRHAVSAAAAASAAKGSIGCPLAAWCACNSSADSCGGCDGGCDCSSRHNGDSIDCSKANLFAWPPFHVG